MAGGNYPCYPRGRGYTSETAASGYPSGYPRGSRGRTGRQATSATSLRNGHGSHSKRTARSSGYSSHSPRSRRHHDKHHERPDEKRKAKEAEPLDVADWEFVRMQIHCAINASIAQRTLQGAVEQFGDHRDITNLSHELVFALLRNILHISHELISDEKVSGLCALLDPEKVGHVGIADLEAFLKSAVLPEKSALKYSFRNPKVLWDAPEWRASIASANDDQGPDYDWCDRRREPHSGRSPSPTYKVKASSPQETEWHFDPRNIHDTRMGIVRREAMERDRKKAATYRLHLALFPFQSYAVKQMLTKAESEMSESEGSSLAVSPSPTPTSPSRRYKGFPLRISRPGKQDLSLKETYARLEFDLPLNRYIACLQDAIYLGREAGLNDQELTEAVTMLDSMKQARSLVRAQVAAETGDSAPSSPHR